MGLGWIIANIKTVLAIVGAVLLGIAVAAIRKSGADAEKALEAKRVAEATKIVTKNRTEAQSASDAELDKKVSKWTRK